MSGTKFQWWKLPADFVPPEPFHPRLTIVTEAKIARRAARLAKNDNLTEAKELLLGYGRAMHPFEKLTMDNVTLREVSEAEFSKLHGSGTPVITDDSKGGAA